MKEFSVRFVGARRVTAEGESKAQQVFHYHISQLSTNNPQLTQRENVPSYEAVVYRGLYDGIDLRVSQLSTINHQLAERVTGGRTGIKYEFMLRRERTGGLLRVLSRRCLQVVDASGVVGEQDEANNAYPQSVRVVPGWVPRMVDVRVLTNGNVRLTVEVAGTAATNLVVESPGTLASPIPWLEEPSALFTTNGAGNFEAELPQQGASRFYRIKVE